MASEKHKYLAEMFREFLLFFGVLFFTCVVGIVGLLPEFDKINGLFSGSFWVISALYFGLIFGIDFSIQKCFFIYWEIKTFTKEFAFRFPEIEDATQKVFRGKPKYLEWFLILIITSEFVLLYLVKIKVLL